MHDACYVVAAKAVRSLVEFMDTEKSSSGLCKNLTIYGEAFSSVEAFASVLQVTCKTLVKRNVGVNLSSS